MKAVILAGGLGTRIQEESRDRPKPMVEIGGKPILWHIMKIFYSFGIDDFIICCGYKGYQIKEYFANYLLHMSDVTFDFSNRETTVHKERGEQWRVSLCDTGEASLTGERLKRIQKLLKDDEPFLFTYGDGVSDININKLLDFHACQGKLATLTAVIPKARFGALNIEGDLVTNFQEKPKTSEGYINGGFFVLDKRAIEFVKNGNESWEGKPLENLSQAGELSAFKHNGFWQPMDTLRDKIYLQDLWSSNNAPWKSWHDE